MFAFCKGTTNLDISNFITSNVNNMGNMFNVCESLTRLNLTNVNTTNVTNMGYMFYNCENLTELDLSGFDMRNVSNVGNMLGGCKVLTTLSSPKNIGKGYTQKTNNYSDYKLGLSNCTKLTYESLLDVITNGLYDLNLTYDVANGGTLYTQTIQLGSKNLAKLTSEEIAMATKKGWSVS
jgi:surface protein